MAMASPATTKTLTAMATGIKKCGDAFEDEPDPTNGHDKEKDGEASSKRKQSSDIASRMLHRRFRLIRFM
jgi:hypothetical protein